MQIHTARWFGSGETIVCLHGLSGNLYCWNFLAPYLNKIGYNVIAYDLRGRGTSGKPESAYGFENHLSDLTELLKYYRLENPILLGHSFGCMIAVRFAIQFPTQIKKMILMDGGGLLSVSKKLQVLKVLKLSFDRLGKVFPTKKVYLDLIKNSPLVPKWTKQVEKYFLLELQKMEKGFICHMPVFVMEEELKEMGASMNEINIVKYFFQSPINFISKIIKNRNLDFEKIQSAVLILRATEMNLFPDDDLLPLKSYQEMLNRIVNSSGAEIKSNHYGILFDKNPDRDKRIKFFLKN